MNVEKKKLSEELDVLKCECKVNKSEVSFVNVFSCVRKILIKIV